MGYSFASAGYSPALPECELKAAMHHQINPSTTLRKKRSIFSAPEKNNV
jgi:hypothetical protein